MLNELEKIKEIEAELIKVRLTITEKEQKKEKKQKIANAWIGAGGFMGFLTLCAFFAENKLIAFIPGGMLALIMFFGFKKTFEISKLDLDIRKSKKKKKTVRRWTR